MAVYVDDARIPARVGRLTARWSHLTADTKTELHDFAARLGLRRAWFQDQPRGLWHYDVTDGRRVEALRLGAIPIPYVDSDVFARVWRRPGREGVPDSTGRAGQPPTRLGVTGSRWHGDQQLIRAGLVDAGRLLGRDTVLVEGEADGADGIAAGIWAGWGLEVEPHPADWGNCVPACRPGHQRRRRNGDRYCPAAGNRRNAEMVQAGAALWLAYPLRGSVGTLVCMRMATAAGIEVWEYTRDPVSGGIIRRVHPGAGR